jgi:transcriptional regulator
MFSRELKKGSPELLILALLEEKERHGYEIGKLIETRSDGRMRFRIGSLYPVLSRLEDKGLINGRWVEASGGPRRRFYRLSAKGRQYLKDERNTWEQYVAAVNQIIGAKHA